jgi:hypothetical protein
MRGWLERRGVRRIGSLDWQVTIERARFLPNEMPEVCNLVVMIWRSILCRLVALAMMSKTDKLSRLTSATLLS